MSFKALDPSFLVSPQIGPTDMAGLAARGVSTIVNNRPDGEEPDQPAGAEIEAAARAAGLDYRHIPVAGGFGPDEIRAMAEAIDGAQGKLLAFCKSGTRSTYLWAMARASRGADGSDLIARAAEAGYDLGPLRAYMLR